MKKPGEPLKVSSHSINFAVEPNKSKSYFRLSLLNQDDRPKGFKIKTSNRELCVVKPTSGLIDPGKEAAIEFTLETSGKVSPSQIMSSKFCLYTLDIHEPITPQFKLDEYIKNNQEFVKKMYLPISLTEKKPTQNDSAHFQNESNVGNATQENRSFDNFSSAVEQIEEQNQFKSAIGSKIGEKRGNETKPLTSNEYSMAVNDEIKKLNAKNQLLEREIKVFQKKIIDDNKTGKSKRNFQKWQILFFFLLCMVIGGYLNSKPNINKSWIIY